MARCLSSGPFLKVVSVTPIPAGEYSNMKYLELPHVCHWHMHVVVACTSYCRMHITAIHMPWRVQLARCGCAARFKPNWRQTMVTMNVAQKRS